MNATKRQQILNALDAQIAQCSMLSQLTAPLYKHFGITSFAMTILYESGQWLYLNNNKKLLIQSIESDAARKEQACLSSPYWIRNLSQLGMYLEDHIDPTHTTIHPLLAEYDFQHPFTCLEQIETKPGRALRLCVYRAPKAHREIKHFYLNNIELLKRFNDHIVKELADVLSKLPLITPTPKEQAHYQQHFQNVIPDTKRQKTFVKETGLHYPKYNEFENLQLSKRQREVIHWYLLGKTALDTAEILNLSVRTIHEYFERLKNKFDCYTKSQLLLKLIDGGFLNPNDWKAIYPKTTAKTDE